MNTISRVILAVITLTSINCNLHASYGLDNDTAQRLKQLMSLDETQILPLKDEIRELMYNGDKAPLKTDRLKLFATVFINKCPNHPLSGILKELGVSVYSEDEITQAFSLLHSEVPGDRLLLLNEEEDEKVDTIIDNIFAKMGDGSVIAASGGSRTEQDVMRESRIQALIAEWMRNITAKDKEAFINEQAATAAMLADIAPDETSDINEAIKLFRNMSI